MRAQPGERYGRLVLESSEGMARWRCRCDCGAVHVAIVTDMRAGKTRSCGCLRREATATAQREHGYKPKGQRPIPEYEIWQAAKRRCDNPKHPQAHRYSERGIRMCDRWLHDFPAFLADMGPRPSTAHSIERIDQDGPYSPENCRWASRTEQQRNTSQNRLLTHDGETRTLAEWAEARGIRYGRLYYRLTHGWTPERAFGP